MGIFASSHEFPPSTLPHLACFLAKSKQQLSGYCPLCSLPCLSHYLLHECLCGMVLPLHLEHILRKYSYNSVVELKSVNQAKCAGLMQPNGSQTGGHKADCSFFLFYVTYDRSISATQSIDAINRVKAVIIGPVFPSISIAFVEAALRNKEIMAALTQLLRSPLVNVTPIISPLLAVQFNKAAQTCQSNIESLKLLEWTLTIKSDGIFQWTLTDWEHLDRD